MNKQTWFTIIVLVIGIMIITFALKDCRKPITTYNPLSDSVLYWKNLHGQEVASHRGTKEEFALIDQFWEDSIARVYKTRRGDIRYINVTTVKGKTTLPPITPETDFDIPCPNCPNAVLSMRDTFANTWNKVIVQLGQGRGVELESTDTITTIVKKVREGNIFNRKHKLQVDMSNADTGRHITGMRIFIPYETPKQLSLNLQGSVIYLWKDFYPVLSTGLERSSKWYSAGISAGREFKNNSFYGQADFKFKILRFK